MTVRDWLAKNTVHLRDYSPDELAHLARLVDDDWTWEDICDAIPDYHMDWATRTTFEIRRRWFVDRELRAVDHIGKLDLTENWCRLARYERGLDA